MAQSLRKDFSIAWWGFIFLDSFNGREDSKVFINGVPALTNGGFSRGTWRWNKLFPSDAPSFVQGYYTVRFSYYRGDLLSFISGGNSIEGASAAVSTSILIYSRNKILNKNRIQRVTFYDHSRRRLSSKNTSTQRLN